MQKIIPGGAHSPSLAGTDAPTPDESVSSERRAHQAREVIAALVYDHFAKDGASGRMYFAPERVTVTVADSKNLCLVVDYDSFSGDCRMAQCVPLVLGAELIKRGVDPNNVSADGCGYRDYDDVYRGKLKAVLPNNGSTLEMLRSLELSDVVVRGTAIAEQLLTRRQLSAALEEWGTKVKKLAGNLPPDELPGWAESTRKTVDEILAALTRKPTS
jgi:hypothetical protein